MQQAHPALQKVVSLNWNHQVDIIGETRVNGVVWYNVRYFKRQGIYGLDYQYIHKGDIQ